MSNSTILAFHETFGSDLSELTKTFLRTDDTRSLKCATVRLQRSWLEKKVNKHQKMIETHDGGNVRWREDDDADYNDRTSLLLLPHFVFSPHLSTVINLYAYIYHITIRFDDDSKPKWASQHTRWYVVRLWFAHNMSKEVGSGGDVDDNDEARVSFIYHFNIYPSSSSPLSNGTNQKANNTE